MPRIAAMLDPDCARAFSRHFTGLDELATLNRCALNTVVVWKTSLGRPTAWRWIYPPVAGTDSGDSNTAGCEPHEPLTLPVEATITTDFAAWPEVYQAYPRLGLAHFDVRALRRARACPVLPRDVCMSHA
jgi:hypothetical protein